MKLDDLPKRNVYQVPEQYFDRLPNRMMHRVNQATKSENPIYAYWKLPYLRPVLAGVFFVLSLATFFLVKQNQPLQSNELLASISGQEAMEYLIRMENLELHDLSLLSQTEQDLSHEFIQASQEEILEEVEQSDLEDHIY